MSSTREIHDLDDRLRRFMRTPSARFLDIVAAADVRDPVLRLVMGQELHAANLAPFYAFEDACTRDDDGFTARTERLAEQHSHRCATVQRETGTNLPGLVLPPAVLPPIARFADSLVRVVRAHLPWNRGVVVVLAPTLVDDPQTWSAAVDGLVRLPSVAHVRWITIHTESSPLGAVIERLGSVATSTTCALDHAALGRELELRLALMASTPRDAPGPARAGCAWPRGVMPPRRRFAPPTSAPPDSRAAAEEDLPRHVLEGAKAMRNGDARTAVRRQVEARDAALRAELPRIAVIMELVLGAYFVGAKCNDSAKSVYRQAIERADRGDMLDLGAQGWFAFAAIELAIGDRVAAAKAYIEAGRMAERGAANVLAIEAFRMAGRLRADDGDDMQAVALWRRALARVHHLDEGERSGGGAAETARDLAQLLRRRGLAREADAALADAERFAVPGIVQVGVAS